MANRLTERYGANGEDVWLDAGYVGTEGDVKGNGMNLIICEKSYRGHPLTERQKESNCEKSKVRCRVEHVFGFMEQTMGGQVRAAANVVMTNLVYNMCRLAQIVRYHKEWITVNNRFTTLKKHKSIRKTIAYK